jgi:PAS domain S-box-containing protein
MAPGGPEVLEMGRGMRPDDRGRRSFLKELGLAALGFLPVVAVIVIVAFFFCRIQQRTGRDIILNNELQTTELESRLLEKNFLDAVEDILYVSRLGVLINLRGEPLSIDNVGRIGSIYRSFLARKGAYENVRVLGPGGKELVRVDYNDGDPRVVPAEELEDKSTRYYFQSARSLEEGDIYISPLDRSSGRGGASGIPVVRLATPIYSRGELFGVVVLNLRGNSILDAIAEGRSYSYGELILGNEESYWLFSDGDEPSWAFLREEEIGEDLPPGFFRTVEAVDEGYRFSEGNLTVVRTIYPLVVAEEEYRARGTDRDFSSTFAGTRYRLKLISFVSEEVFRSRVRPFRIRTMITSAAVALFGYLLLFFLVRMRSRRIAAEKNVLEQAGIFQFNPAPVIKTDPRGRIVSTNPAAARTLSEDLTGRKVDDVLVGYGPAQYGDMSRHGYTQFEDSRLGRTHLYTGIREASGEAMFFYGTDISDRKKAERELTLLSYAVEQSANTIVITDPDGSIVFANKAFTRTTGYTLEEALGQNPRILKSGYQPDQYYSELWKTISGGGVWHGEFHNRRKDGSTYWEEAVISPVKDETGRIINYLAVKEDITKRRRAEEELRQAKEEAEAANRMKSEFLANMSHEIRTPMNAILGFTELLLEEEPDRERLEKLDIIKKSGKNLLNLLNDILDFSKIEAGKLLIEPGYFSLRRAVEHVVSLYEPVATEKGLDFLSIPDVDLPGIVYGDELRLTQIIINIVSNAVKFTETGGVTLRCTYVRPDVIITVADTGIGISADKIASIFSAFEQADSSTERKYGGTGLGLAISKRLAEMMGGSIHVQSVPGEGSVFTLTVELPPMGAEGGSGGTPLSPHGMNEEGIDGEAMVRRWFDSLGGDSELEEILKDGILELPGKVERLDDAVVKRRASDVRFLAHDFKGFSGNLNMTEIYTHVAAIEKEARGVSPDFEAISRRCEFVRGIVESIPNRYFSEREKAVFDIRKLDPDFSILLAEDNQLNQRLITTYLKGMNLSATVVENGRLALEELKRKDYDLLLLDMQMPVMDGEETIQALRNDPDLDGTYVIAITAHAMKGDAERYINMGCDDYLSKPIDRTALFDKIRRRIRASGRGGTEKHDPVLERRDLNVALYSLKENRAIFDPRKLETIAKLLHLRFSDPELKDIARGIERAAGAFDDRAVDQLIARLEDYVRNFDRE